MKVIPLLVILFMLCAMCALAMPSKWAGGKPAGALTESGEDADTSTAGSETGGDAGASGGHAEARPRRVRVECTETQIAEATMHANKAQDLWSACGILLKAKDFERAEQKALEAAEEANRAESLCPGSDQARRARSAADGAKGAVEFRKKKAQAASQSAAARNESAAPRNEAAAPRNTLLSDEPQNASYKHPSAEERGRAMEAMINSFEHMQVAVNEDEIDQNKKIVIVVQLKSWNGHLEDLVNDIQKSKELCTVKPTKHRRDTRRFLMSNAIGFRPNHDINPPAHPTDNVLVVNSPWQTTMLPHYQQVPVAPDDLLNASRSVITHQLLSARYDQNTERKSKNLNVWLKAKIYGVWFKYDGDDVTKCLGISPYMRYGQVCRVTIGGESNSSMQVNKNGTLDAFVKATFVAQPHTTYDMAQTANLNEQPRLSDVHPVREVFISAEHIGALVGEDPMRVRREHWMAMPGVQGDMVEIMLTNLDALRTIMETVSGHHTDMLRVGKIDVALMRQVLDNIINNSIDELLNVSEEFKKWMKEHFQAFYLFEGSHPEVEPSFLRVNLDGLPLSAIMYGVREDAHEAYASMHNFFMGLFRRVNDNFDTMEEHVHQLLEVVNVFNGGSDGTLDEMHHLSELVNNMARTLPPAQATELRDSFNQFRRRLNRAGPRVRTGEDRVAARTDPDVRARTEELRRERELREAAESAAAESAAAESAAAESAAGEDAEQTSGAATRKRGRTPGIAASTTRRSSRASSREPPSREPVDEQAQDAERRARLTRGMIPSAPASDGQN
jgi:hypothetical protein